MPNLITDISHIAYTTHEGIRLKVYKDSYKISRHSLKVKWVQTIQYEDSLSRADGLLEIQKSEGNTIDSSVLCRKGYWSHLLSNKVK